MWSHYLITLYRSLTRHRLYAALNVLGLAVGIAVFLVLWLDVRFETSFEKWIPDAAQIYELRTVEHSPRQPIAEDGNSNGNGLFELRADYPGTVGARLWSQQVTVRRGAELTPETLQVTDPTFFNVFDIPLVEGDRATALAAPDGLVLTQAKARQYFGGADPMGRQLTIAILGVERTYRVTGVLRDPPKSTDLTLDFLVPLTSDMTAQDFYWTHWGSEQVNTYLRFTTPQAAAALDADLDNFIDRRAAGDFTSRPVHKSISIKLRPLLSLHLLNAADKATVAALGLVGLFTLLLAAVNYVNLATARAGLRAREVALRKVMGATPPALFGQFMAESIVTATLAALIGLALCELALPLVNAAGGLSLKLNYFSLSGPMPALLVAVAVTGLGAGAYPASILSKYRPAAVLASARAPGGGRAGGRVREALVLFQFAIAIAFTVATFVIFAQLHYLRTADIGFQRAGLIVVGSSDDSQVTSAQQTELLEAWKGVPGVVSDTVADIGPGNSDTTDAAGFKRPGMVGRGLTLFTVQTGPGGLQTFGARLAAGRFLNRDRGGDAGPNIGPPVPGAPIQKDLPPGEDRPIRNVVANETALRLLGFHDPQQAVGALLLQPVRAGGNQRLVIVGVVHDIRFRSPHDPVPPTLYYMDAEPFATEIASVRFAGADPQAVMDGLRRAWRSIVPDVPFRAKTAQDNLATYYRPDDQHGRLFTIGAVLAVAIGCVGLYGLASFNTARRVKEIGIRKTLGASTGDILKLLVGQFLRPVVLANLVAWPLAFRGHAYVAGQLRPARGPQPALLPRRHGPDAGGGVGHGDRPGAVGGDLRTRKGAAP